jgi:hypothetical protein
MCKKRFSVSYDFLENDKRKVQFLQLKKSALTRGIYWCKIHRDMLLSKGIKAFEIQIV